MLRIVGRIAVAALVVLAVACGGGGGGGGDGDPPTPPITPMTPPRGAPTAPAASAAAKPAWSFVVISDVHLPNPKRAVIDKEIAAIIAMKPRFVVIAGDLTNGNPWNPPALVAGSIYWWKVVTAALQPLRDAHIPVLPVAGNHDSYLPGQRAHYKATFDLATWAAPLVPHGAVARGELGSPPFSYGIDVDDVHISLVHVVQEWLDKDVASWLADDLDDAAKSRIRIVVSHAPWHTVIAHERPAFETALGNILEAGNTTLYLAGHEHLFWDEDFALPRGGKLHQVMTGCISGWYNYGPNKDEIARAHCAKTILPGRFDVPTLACAMPHGGGTFTLSRDRRNRMIENGRAEITVVTIPAEGTAVVATPLVLDGDGKFVPFYLGDSQRASSGSTR